MKLYDVIAQGERKYGLPEEEVTRLYSSGVLNRRSPCRVYGSDEWRNIDECLPRLKYTIQSLAPVSPPPHERGQPAPTTALRAGWICFGLGLLVAWFFPPAYFFFSVAIVTAIVAMCTREVNRGLILLLSSFIGLGLCVVVSFVLAIGLFASVASLALSEVREDIKQARTPTPAVVPKLAPLPTRSPAPTIPPQSTAVPERPRVETSVRQQVPAATPLRAIAHLTQREIFEEIARIEKQQRELRSQRSDLSPAMLQRLEQLRAALQ